MHPTTNPDSVWATLPDDVKYHLLAMLDQQGLGHMAQVNQEGHHLVDTMRVRGYCDSLDEHVPYVRQFVDMHMGDQNNAAAAQAAFVALGEVLAQIEQESGVDTANWDQWQNDAHYDPVYQRWVNMQDIFTWYHNTFD